MWSYQKFSKNSYLKCKCLSKNLINSKKSIKLTKFNNNNNYSLLHYNYSSNSSSNNNSSNLHYFQRRSNKNFCMKIIILKINQFYHKKKAN